MAAEAAYLALGSNLGEPLEQLRRALRELGGLGRVRGRSSLYRTAPVGGPPGQPPYLNAAVALEPDPEHAEPQALLAALLEIERRHGRERRQRWAARTLDLDLLAYGQQVLATPALTLPHPRMMERAFVLAPLCELEPGWRHPLSSERACEALERLGAFGVERTDLGWEGPSFTGPRPPA